MADKLISLQMTEYQARYLRRKLRKMANGKFSLYRRSGEIEKSFWNDGVMLEAMSDSIKEQLHDQP